MYFLLKTLFFPFILSTLLGKPAPAPLEVHVVVTNPTCTGTCDGKVKAIVTGGQPGYMYQWSNGLKSENYYDACAGKGSVTVKDIAGNTATADWEIKDPPPIGIDRMVTNQPSAGISDGRIEVEVTGGLLPYQFSLDGVKYSTSNVFNGLGPGSYIINIRDTNGCNVQSSAVTLEVVTDNVNLKTLYHLTYNEENKLIHLYSNIPLYMHLTDLQGRVLLDTESSKSHDIPMGDLYYGFYILKITDGLRSSYEKIIKIHP